MSININRVYQRVLLLANKDQRGYITPEEFNSYADQAQKEVFESYFLKKFQVDQAPGTMDDYSDIAANVEEKITFFDNVTTISSRGNTDDEATYRTTSDNAYVYPNDFYRLGEVTVNGRMADEVSHKDLTYINLSPLTKPTETQPVFTRHEGGVVVYPTSYTGAITMVYVRQPAEPVWGYLDDPTGQPVNNPATTTDFELHPSDEQELVYKILSMAGITIKAADIAQYAGGKEGQIAQQEA